MEFQLLKAAESIGFWETSRVVTKIFTMFENASHFKACILLNYRQYLFSLCIMHRNDTVY